MSDAAEIRCTQCNKLLFRGIASGEFCCPRCGAREKHSNVESWAELPVDGAVRDSKGFELFQSFAHLQDGANG